MTTKYIVQEQPWGAFLEFNKGIPPARHADPDGATRFNTLDGARFMAKADGVPRFTVVSVEE